MNTEAPWEQEISRLVAQMLTDQEKACAMERLSWLDG